MTDISNNISGQITAEAEAGSDGIPIATLIAIIIGIAVGGGLLVLFIKMLRNDKAGKIANGQIQPEQVQVESRVKNPPNRQPRNKSPPRKQPVESDLL